MPNSGTTFSETLGLISNVLQIAGIPGVGFLVLYFWRRGRKAQKRLDALIETVAADADQIKELEHKIAIMSSRVDKYDPHVWLEVANKERADGNEATAIDVLRSGVLGTTLAMQKVYLELARHHIALYPDHDERQQLLEAERLARIANQLRPDDYVARRLLEEVDATLMSNGLRRHFDPAWKDVGGFDSACYGRVADTAAVETVDLLISRANEQAKAGNYWISERLAYRARLIALTAFGEASTDALNARFLWAYFVERIGLLDEALKELNILIPICESTPGREHSFTLAARSYRVQVLNGLRRGSEAIQEIDDVLRLREQIDGSEDAGLLNARFLKAQALYVLDRLEESVIELDKLVPISQRTLGPEHRDTLTSRSVRAQVLSGLGRNEEAIQEYDELLPMLDRVHGDTHPEGLSTKVMRLQVLCRLGRNEEALHEIASLVRLRELTSGSSHPETLTARYVRGRVLQALDCSEAALQELDELLPIREQVSGMTHPDTIATRKLRDEVRQSLMRN